MKPPLPPEREGPTRQRRAGEGLSDNAYDALPTERSRRLRNDATPAERKLWGVLRNRQLKGVRFNRQVVIRPYICDFVARSARLIIEIDGGQHGDTVCYDAARTSFLEAQGYTVIRFWNNEVLGNLQAVVDIVERALTNRPSPSRLRRSSPPASAGGVKQQ